MVFSVTQHVEPPPTFEDTNGKFQSLLFGYIYIWAIYY